MSPDCFDPSIQSKWSNCCTIGWWQVHFGQVSPIYLFNSCSKPIATHAFIRLGRFNTHFNIQAEAYTNKGAVSTSNTWAAIQKEQSMVLSVLTCFNVETFLHGSNTHRFHTNCIKQFVKKSRRFQELFHQLPHFGDIKSFCMMHTQPLPGKLPPGIHLEVHT